MSQGKPPNALKGKRSTGRGIIIIIIRRRRRRRRSNVLWDQLTCNDHHSSD